MRALDGTSSPGMTRVVWDLADGDRRPMPAGTYAVTLEVGEPRLSRPAVVR